MHVFYVTSLWVAFTACSLVPRATAPSIHKTAFTEEQSILQPVGLSAYSPAGPLHTDTKKKKKKKKKDRCQIQCTDDQGSDRTSNCHLSLNKMTLSLSSPTIFRVIEENEARRWWEGDGHRTSIRDQRYSSTK